MKYKLRMYKVVNVEIEYIVEIDKENVNEIELDAITAHLETYGSLPEPAKDYVWILSKNHTEEVEYSNYESQKLEPKSKRKK